MTEPDPLMKNQQRIQSHEIADVKFKLLSKDAEKENICVLAHSAILCSTSRLFRGILNIAPEVPQPSISRMEAVGLGKVPVEVIREKVYYPLEDFYVETVNGKKQFVFIVSKDMTEPAMKALLKFIYSGATEIPNNDVKTQLIRCSSSLLFPDLETYCTNVGAENEEFNPSITTWLMDQSAYTARDIFFMRNLGQGKMSLSISNDNFKPLIKALESRLEDSPTAVVLIVEFLRPPNIEIDPGFFYTGCPALYDLISNEKPIELGKAQAPFPENSYEALLKMIEYVYSGHVDIDDNTILPLMVLAHRFDITRLRTLCSYYLSAYIDRKIVDRIAEADVNVIQLLEQANRCQMAQAVKYLRHFIASNYEPMSKTKEFALLKGMDKRYVEKNRWPPLKYYKAVENYKKKAAEWDKKYGDKDNLEAAADKKLFSFKSNSKDATTAESCVVM